MKRGQKILKVITVLSILLNIILLVLLFHKGNDKSQVTNNSTTVNLLPTIPKNSSSTQPILTLPVGKLTEKTASQIYTVKEIDTTKKVIILTNGTNEITIPIDAPIFKVVKRAGKNLVNDKYSNIKVGMKITANFPDSTTSGQLIIEQ